MALQSPGPAIRVPTPGTNVWAAADIANIDVRPAICHGFMFQALPGNTGKVYIGLKGMVAATPDRVLGFIAIPTANHIPAFSVALTLAPNALTINDIWIDADVSNDGVILSYLVL